MKENIRLNQILFDFKLKLLINHLAVATGRLIKVLNQILNLFKRHCFSTHTEISEYTIKGS